LKNTEAQILLAHPALIKNAIAAAKQAGVPKTRVFQFSDKENPTTEDVKDWRQLLSSAEEAARYSWPGFTLEQSRNTIATINYFSGTTGLPKGVCVSHYNLNAMIQQTIFIKYHLKPYSFAN
jgi:4-coumarate--CoA ligase